MQSSEDGRRERRKSVRRVNPPTGPAPARSTNAPFVLVLSRDPSLRLLVVSSCDSDCKVETAENIEAARQLALSRNVCLIVLDDEVLPAAEREWSLAKISQLLVQPPILYVASRHDSDVERMARSRGATYYTAKPVEPERLGRVLQTCLRHIRERNCRSFA